MANIFSNISTISDLLNNFAAVDVVGIFDENLQQVFQEARPLKADVKETAQVMTHPIETGVKIADNKIINQVEITLNVMINSRYYNSVYTQIKQAFVSGTLLSIQTRTGVYPNMIVRSMPHQETPDEYDSIIMQLDFIEVLYAVPTSVSAQSAPANFKPADEINSNTVQSGIKSPTILTTENVQVVQGVLGGLAFKQLGGF